MSSSQRGNEQDGDGSERGHRALLVLAEDNEDTSRVYSLILRHYGYDVVESKTGEEAIARTRALHPDLVLMDIGLPGIDGWEATSVLKADPATRAIPVVAFSASVNSTTDLVRPTEAFDGFIVKPIGPRELVQRVDAYVQLLCTEPRLTRGRGKSSAA